MTSQTVKAAILAVMMFFSLPAFAVDFHGIRYFPEAQGFGLEPKVSVMPAKPKVTVMPVKSGIAVAAETKAVPKPKPKPKRVAYEEKPYRLPLNKEDFYVLSANEDQLDSALAEMADMVEGEGAPGIILQLRNVYETGTTQSLWDNNGLVSLKEMLLRLLSSHDIWLIGQSSQKWVNCEEQEPCPVERALLLNKLLSSDRATASVLLLDSIPFGDRLNEERFAKLLHSGSAIIVDSNENLIVGPTQGFTLVFVPKVKGS